MWETDFAYCILRYRVSHSTTCTTSISSWDTRSSFTSIVWRQEAHVNVIARAHKPKTMDWHTYRHDSKWESTRTHWSTFIWNCPPLLWFCSIAPDAFLYTFALGELLLSGNSITVIPIELLANTPALKAFKVDRNRIVALPLQSNHIASLQDVSGWMTTVSRPASSLLALFCLGVSLSALLYLVLCRNFIVSPVLSHFA